MVQYRCGAYTAIQQVLSEHRKSVGSRSSVSTWETAACHMSLDDTTAETSRDCFIFISSLFLYGLRPLRTQGVVRSMPLLAVDPSSLLSQPVFALRNSHFLSASAYSHSPWSSSKASLFLSPFSCFPIFTSFAHSFPSCDIIILGRVPYQLLRSLDSLLNLPMQRTIYTL